MKWFPHFSIGTLQKKPKFKKKHMVVNYYLISLTVSVVGCRTNAYDDWRILGP